jgi:hypothetical protein
MAEITEDMIKQAEKVCMPSLKDEALIAVRDFAFSIGATAGAGLAVGGPAGAAIGADIGIVTGVIMTATDISPDAGCVGHVLKDKSRER